MRRRGRMAGERLRVAQVDQALEQAKRVVELRSRRKAALDPEGQERAGAAAEILLRQRVVRAVREASIAHPVDATVTAKEFGDLARVLDVALDPQRHRLDPLQQQERIERREHRAGVALIDAASARGVGSLAETLA